MMAKQSQTLGGLWSTLTDGISMSMAGMVTTIVNAFHLKSAITAVIGFTSTVGDFMQAAVGRIAAAVMSVGAPVAAAVGSVFGGIYNAVASVVGGVSAFVGSSWGAIAGVATAAFGGVYNAVSAAVAAIYAFVAPIVSSVADVVAANWMPMATSVIGYFNSIYNVISSTLSAAWTVVQSVGPGIAAAWSWAMDAIGLKSTAASSAVSSAFGAIMKATTWLYDTVSLAFNILAFGVQNFQTVIAAAMTASAYEIVKFGSQVTYFFADLIPGYLAWFGRNWSQVFTDAATMTATVFSNLSGNVAGFFSALWSAMKGDGFNFEWTGLTEGFKSALTELPQIAERQVGSIEQTLGDTAASLNAQLSQGLGQYLAEQDAKTKAAAEAIKKTADGIGKSIGNAASGGVDEVSRMAGDVDEFFKNADGKITIDNSAANAAIDKTKAKASELKTLAAGSAEAMQVQAQAKFDLMAKAVTPAGTSAPAAATPTAAPAPDWQAADRAAPAKDAATQDMTTQLAALLAAGNRLLASIVTNTATKPIVLKPALA